MNRFSRRTTRARVTLPLVVTTALLVLATLNAGRVGAGPVPALHSERQIPEARLAKGWVIYNRPYTDSDYMDPNPRIAASDYNVIRAETADFIMRLDPADGEQNSEPARWMRLEPEALEAGAYAQAVLADCLHALKSGTTKQKRQAAAALAQKSADEILPARKLLIRLLNDPEVRMVALRALARMGLEAKPAIPEIQPLLASDDIFIREAAIWTLCQIGSAAVEALAACACDDPHHNVASQARKALDWIWDHELNLYR